VGDERIIASRLESIEQALSVSSIRVLADPMTRRLTVWVRASRSPGPGVPRSRAEAAQVIELSEQEILSDNYLELARQRVNLFVSFGTDDAQDREIGGYSRAPRSSTR